MEFTDVTKRDTVLFETKKEIYPGEKDNIQTEIKIPPEVIGYTAIGSIISRAYFLVLVAEMACCYSNP